MVIRVAAAAVLVALLATGPASPAPRTRCPVGTGFAHLAYVKAGALVVLDMPACGGRVLVPRGASAPVRWSADGRYVSFRTGVVSVADARVYRGLRGSWSPLGHSLATLTDAGGVVIRRPGMEERRLIHDGFGAQSLAFDPAGERLAIGRGQPRGTAAPAHRELWILDLRTGARRLVYRPPAKSPRTPVVVRWAGDFVLFQLALLPAISANLDGLSLYAIAGRGGGSGAFVDAVLSYEELLASCRGRVVVAAGRDRVMTRGKRLVAGSGPHWRLHEVSRDRTRSWVSPACSPDGRWITASAGRNWLETRFGLERRSIWLLRADGNARRRLTTAPRRHSDELPRWSRDGQSVFFIRTGPTRRDGSGRGRLYVLRVAGGKPEPLADLGTTGNYYGRYGWAEQTDLFVPRGSQAASR